MTGAGSSDAMKKLVFFVIGLAIFGIIIALLIYFAVDLPAQQALLSTPSNAFPTEVNGQVTDAIT